MAQKVQDLKHMLTVQEDFLKEQNQHITNMQVKLTQKTEENVQLKESNEALIKQIDQLHSDIVNKQTNIQFAHHTNFRTGCIQRQPLGGKVGSSLSV